MLFGSLTGLNKSSQSPSPRKISASTNDLMRKQSIRVGGLGNSISPNLSPNKNRSSQVNLLQLQLSMADQQQKNGNSVTKLETGQYQKLKQDKLLKEVQFLSTSEDDKMYQNYLKCEIQPGIQFLKIFMANAKRQRPMKLQINIPLSIGLFQEKMLIYTSKKTGLVKVTLENEVKEQDFLYKLQRRFQKQITQLKEKGFLQKDFEEDFPIMLYKRVESTQQNFNQVIPNGEEQNITPHCMLYNCIGQQFIISSGLKASLYRYHHFNPIYSSSNKQHYAYFMTNTALIEMSKDKETTCLNLDGYPKHTQIYKVHNMNTFSFHQVAEQLILLIQKHYGITIKEIVLDFIKDINGVEWLIGCRAFKTVPRQDAASSSDKFRHGLLFDLLRNNSEARLMHQRLKKEQLIEKATTATICKLCKIKFRKEQMQRVVTDTLLAKFTIAENKLINIESSFAKMLNIPVYNNIGKFGGKESQLDIILNKKSVLIQNLPQKPIQWRVLIYLQEFLEASINQLISMAENDIYIQFKIFETVTKFKWISREKQAVDLKNLDFVKVFYFFTMPNDSISTLQQNTVLEFKLTDGKSFTHDQVLASGKIQPFLQFNESTFQEKQATVKDFEFYSTKIEYFNVTLFSQKLPQQSVRVVVGLKKDYETRSENIRLQLYQGVYIPTDSYYNCDPLPQTWIELFYARQHLQNTQNQSQIQSQDFNQDSTRKLPAFEQAYEDPYVIKNITKDFFVQQKLDEEMQYLPINKLMRYERQLTSEREKSKTKFDHVKSKKDHETFSSMERKRLNLEQSRLSRLITDQSQLQNLSTFRDGKYSLETEQKFW
eukprot:403336337